MRNSIAVVGAGRMGRGIALSYIFAGIPALLVDLKERTDSEREEQIQLSLKELAGDLAFLAKMDLVDEDKIESILSHVSFTHRNAADNLIADCSIIYEGVPEVMDAKKDAFTYISNHASEAAVVASTTSTFLVTDLADLVSNPTRFLNAHWLNPAHLMPLVELSKGDQTSSPTINTLVDSLKSIGKETVICSASPGYIVPRIQAIAMNEAARLVEEGVASAEDVDKAVNFGFGPRFAVLGLLEFIDWGGGDILYYADKYLSQKVGERYSVPDIIASNMKSGKNGIRDGIGFFDYNNIDTEKYRERRMKDFVAHLKHRNLLPTYNNSMQYKKQ